MPPAPVDDHTEEFEQLAGLVALDVLAGEELVRFERHAAICERCRLVVRLDRETLARAAPEMDPSPDFKQRLLERAQRELSDSGPAEPVAIRRAPPNVVRLWRRSPWVSAVAAVFVLAVVTVGALNYENQVVATYALSGSLSGSAVVTVRRSGAAELDMSGIENPPPGFIYEAWTIPQGGQPIPAGTAASGDAQLPLNGLSGGTTVAITQERTRVDAPTSQPVLAVVVPS
jgi:anti-sigma-K factor RskA